MSILELGDEENRFVWDKLVPGRGVGCRRGSPVKSRVSRLNQLELLHELDLSWPPGLVEERFERPSAYN